MCRENSVLFEGYISQLEHPTTTSSNTDAERISVNNIKNTSSNNCTNNTNAPPVLSSVTYMNVNISNTTQMHPLLNSVQYNQLVVENVRIPGDNGELNKFDVKKEPANLPATEESSTNIDYREPIKPEIKEENICDNDEETMDHVSIYNDVTTELMENNHYNTEEDSTEYPNTDEGSHKCMFCNKHFAYKSYLKLHVLKHTGEKPYKCPVCSKEFNRKSNANVHMLIHAGVKPHKCELCPKRFTKKSHLDEHMSCHTGNKPFECNVCGNQFTRKSSLNSHMLIHAGIKSYECSVCKWRFTQKAHLQRHLLTHNGYTNRNKKLRTNINHTSVQQTHS